MALLRSWRDYLTVLPILAVIIIFASQPTRGQNSLVSTATATEQAKLPVITPQNVARLSVKYLVKAHNTEKVSKLAWLPEGKTLASYTYTDDSDGVKLYDTTHIEAQPRYLDGDGIFSPDGNTWASRKGHGYEDDKIKLFDVRTGQLRSMLMGSSAWMAFSPDSAFFAAGTFGLKLWETKTGKSIWDIPPEEVHEITGLDFSPNGKLIATGNSRGQVFLWDAATGQKKAETFEHMNNVRVNFSPDGKYVLGNGIDRNATVCDAQTLKQLDYLGGVSDTIWGEFSPDSSVIALNDASDFSVSQLQLRDFRRKITRATFTLIDKSVASYIAGTSTFSANGRLLAFWTRNETILLINPITGKLLYMLQGLTDFVENVRFSPDAKLLLSWDKSGLVIIWNPATGKKIADFHGKPLKDALFRADGTMLVTAYEDGSLEIWGVS